MSKSKLKVVLIKNGVRELRKSNSMKQIVTEVADSIARRCKGETTQDTYYGKNAINASVGAVEESDNELLKALGGL